MPKIISEVIYLASKDLNIKGIEDPLGDSKKLMAYILEITKEKLILKETDTLSEYHEKIFLEIIARRKRLQPVSQIIGLRTFWGRDFFINSNVLDPRPETEELIHYALKEKFNSVLDLGTGSGVVLITLLLERPKAFGVGIDINVDALEVAKYNSEKFLIDKRIKFLQANWAKNIDKKYDLIVSNPPYIDEKETYEYDSSLAQWEPHNSLFSEESGTAAYLLISSQLKNILSKSGVGLFEIGHNQANIVSRIFMDEGYQTCVFKDLSNKDRVIKVTF